MPVCVCSSRLVSTNSCHHLLLVGLCYSPMTYICLVMLVFVLQTFILHFSTVYPFSCDGVYLLHVCMQRNTTETSINLPCQLSFISCTLYLMFMFSEHVIMQNVPCYVRSLVNNSMYKQMLVKTTDGHAYIFDLRKLQKKTRIYGVDYEKFLEDYKMVRGDRITLEWIPGEARLVIYPRDFKGFPKERTVVQGMLHILFFNLHVKFVDFFLCVVCSSDSAFLVIFVCCLTAIFFKC